MHDYVFAVPGENHIIDTVREDGRSTIQGETLEEIRQRYPGAERMEWKEWRRIESAKQDTPIQWVRCDEHKYHEMLEVLPPLDWSSKGFLVGEASDHSFSTGQPRFQAYRQIGSDAVGYQYAASSRPLTRAEWKAVR